jgi:ATP-dependent DNA ligase
MLQLETCNSGLAVFDLIAAMPPTPAVLCAFDLLEVNGDDIRAEPLKDRKRQLAGLLKLAAEGQQDVAEVSVALKIILSLEGVPCQ